MAEACHRKSTSRGPLLPHRGRWAALRTDLPRVPREVSLWTRVCERIIQLMSGASIIVIVRAIKHDQYSTIFSTAYFLMGSLLLF
ncbi:MAG: hypothetical protein ACRC0L_07840, partial [Angustibacter sp.]